MHHISCYTRSLCVCNNLASVSSKVLIIPLVYIQKCDPWPHNSWNSVTAGTICWNTRRENTGSTKSCPRHKKSTAPYSLQERQAPNWMRRWMHEEVAQMVPIFGLWRVSALRRCESEEHWSKIHGTVWRLKLEASDPFTLLTKASYRSSQPSSQILSKSPTCLPAVTEPIQQWIIFGTLRMNPWDSEWSLSRNKDEEEVASSIFSCSGPCRS